MPGLTADEAAGAPDATLSAGRRLFAADGTSDPIIRSDFSTNILASMSPRVMSDHPLRGLGIFCEDARGSIGHCEVQPSELHSTMPPSSAPPDADLSIWLIERGNLTIEQNNGIHAKFGAGSMLLCDLAHPLRGRWDRSRLGYVRLSRQRLMHALGHAPGSRGRSVETIEHLGLAPFLGSQLTMLASHGAALVPADLESVLGGIFQTAENLLKTMLAPSPESSAEPGADRLQAVHRYIQRNLHRNDLSVADIARGTSISRAQLYRLFASQDMSVHGTLREKRLAKSLSYLRQAESDRLSIGAIAYACGFSDQAVFSKLFRQRFNMTPREARVSARGPAQA